MVSNLHYNIRIFGRVQGVGYRAFIQKKAKSLNITGFVQNESEGTVYIEAEGNKSSLDNFTEWCRVGPARSQVKEIDLKESSLRNFSEFLIR